MAKAGRNRRRRQKKKDARRLKTREAGQMTARRKSRFTSSSASKWWLTLVKRDTCCARCGHVLRQDRQMVYRHEPVEAICIACADEDTAVKYAASVQWERARRKKAAAR
jgi:hypothetical protein